MSEGETLKRPVTPQKKTMNIAAFPKCYIEAIAQHQTMTLFDWIEMAPALGAEGLELYEGFLQSTDPDYLQKVHDKIHTAGFQMPMLCCSPDFTNPDPKARHLAIDNHIKLIETTRHLGGKGAVCRVLSGQRYPEIERAQGIEWVVECIEALIPVARANEIVLGMENHYKDSFWTYPEFAQKMDIFLEIVAAITERQYFGVQYDPSNAIVAGDDPLELLRAIADRVVSVHASDRYLVAGTTLAEMRQHDGTLGYSPNLLHGVTGQGLNDYDAIFSILVEVGYDGWISIEDGMDGMDQMRASVDFLKAMRDRYYPKD